MQAFLILQDTLHRGLIDPSRLNPWLQLILVYGAIAGSAVFAGWRFLKKPIIDRIDAERQARLDQRNKDLDNLARELENMNRDRQQLHALVQKATDAAHVATGKAEVIQLQTSGALTDCGEISEEIARQDGRIQGLRDQMQMIELKNLENQAAIRERLASIETLIRNQKG